MTKKNTVSINFELDPDVNKGLIRDGRKHGRSKRQEARFALNAWFLLPTEQREELLKRVDLSKDS